MGFTDPFSDSVMGYLVLFIVHVSVICIMTFGVATNILLIYSVLRQPGLRHSPTYLTLISLAASDVFGLGGFLFTSFLYTTEPSRSLCLSLVYTGIAALCSSTYHLMAFSVLRYIILVKPLFGMKYLTAKTSVVVCVIIWAVALTISSPSLIFADVASFNTTTNETITVCIHKATSPTYVISAAILLAFFPMAVMAGFHIAKIWQLRKPAIRPKDTKGHNVSAKIVVSILISFAVTSLPNAAFWSVLVGI